MVVEHEFTRRIHQILRNLYAADVPELFERSELLQYLNIKTRSASRGSKSRGSFANLYALYVLIEDYVKHGFHEKAGYSDSEGARFSDLLQRQRELPFGSKLQNHALNHRLNEEFRKYFPTCEYVPILRNAETNRYWINENLLRVRVGRNVHQIAPAVLLIVEAYIGAKRDAFESFIGDCERLQSIHERQPDEVQDFIAGLLRPNVDARVFELVSYAILKPFYGAQMVYWGWSRDDVQEQPLVLYKTGRTNANDGGIDFVMKPLGRFFQVTETTDVRKYFLDIDKIQRFPIAFVVKSEETVETLSTSMRTQAQRAYGVRAVVDRYMDCVEELINIPLLLERFAQVVREGKLAQVVDELVVQSRIEFNMPTEEDAAQQAAEADGREREVHE